MKYLQVLFQYKILLQMELKLYCFLILKEKGVWKLMKVQAKNQASNLAKELFLHV